MINELTKYQEIKLSAYRDKWLKIGLSTGDCDISQAKKAAKTAYQIAGIKEPKYWFVFDSPYSSALAAWILKYHIFNKEPQVWDQVRAQVCDQVRAQVWDQVGAQVWDQVRAQVCDQVGAKVRAQVWTQVGAQVWTQVRDQVWDQVRDQVRAQVWTQVRAQVGDQVWTQVRDQVRDQVWAQVCDQVGDQVWDQVGAQVFGCHDANWLSFYDFFKIELGIKETNKLNGLLELAKHSGWWAPYRNVCIFQHKPDHIKLDDRNLIHCEDDMSIKYRDGFGVYAWHGTRIPASWIKDKSYLTPNIALTHENLEQRRAACEILGWDRILTELNAVEVDKNPNPEIGTLLQVNLPDIGKEKFIQVRCGTGRKFALPVPPDIKTAQEAQNWMWNVPNYNPELRT